MNTLEKLPFVLTNPKSDQGMPKPGDAVIVCRPDGSSSFFLLNVDHKALLAKLDETVELTAEELGKLEAVHKAVTLYLAGQNEKLLTALMEMVNKPDFLSAEQVTPFN